MTTIKSEELWEKVDEQQERLETEPAARQEVAESLVGTLTKLCLLSRHFEDW